MPKPNGKRNRGGPEDSPVAWFAVLERARRTNDFELAAQAQRELQRLGVVVRFARPKARDGKRGRHV